MQQTDIFRIAGVLHAERAADVVGQQPDFFPWHVHQLGEGGQVAGDALRRHMHGEAAAGLVVGGKPRAGLHRHHGDAGVDDIERGDVRGVGESRRRRVAITGVVIERDVVGDVIVEQRRAGLDGVLGFRHRRQRIDLDDHRLGGVARLRGGLRDDASDRIADEADLVDCQRHAIGLQQRRAVGVLQRQGAVDRRVAGLGKILADIDAEHARHLPRRAGVDGADHAMGVGTADHPGISLAGQAEVVGVAALAAHEGIIFLATDRLPDRVLVQGNGIVAGEAGDRSGRLVVHETIDSRAFRATCASASRPR